MSNRNEEVDGDLLKQLHAALDGKEVVYTLAQGRPNWIVDVGPEGVLVETEKSRKDGQGAQLVAAWMLNRAWRHLQSHSCLTNDYLLNALNVKRSSAVCALLAQLPDITANTSHGIELRVDRREA